MQDAARTGYDPGMAAKIVAMRAELGRLCGMDAGTVGPARAEHPMVRRLRHRRNLWLENERTLYRCLLRSVEWVMEGVPVAEVCLANGDETLICTEYRMEQDEAARAAANGAPRGLPDVEYGVTEVTICHHDDGDDHVEWIDSDIPFDPLAQQDDDEGEVWQLGDEIIIVDDDDDESIGPNVAARFIVNGHCFPNRHPYNDPETWVRIDRTSGPTEWPVPRIGSRFLPN
jgi:hypothetical protein